MPILLFSHLLTGRVDRDDVAALRGLAQLPVGERALWLGVLAPALAHEDPEVRAAALAALAGSRGNTAFRAMVSALDDGALAVREAAVAALRASSHHMSGRWALALFHRDASVRRAVVQGPAPTGCEPLAVHLVLDPACADAVALPAAPGAVGALLRAWRAGALEAERVRAWIETHLGPPLFTELIRYRWRTPSEVDPIVDDEEPGIAHDDSLEDFFELWCDDALDPARRVRVLRAARSQLVGRTDTHRRGAAAVLALLRRRGRVPAELAALLGAIFPAALADARLPRALRLAAAEGPLEHGSGTPLLDGARVGAVLAGDLLRDGEGQLEARALAALLSVAPDAVARERVLAALDDAELGAALDRDPIRAAPLVGQLAIAKRLEALLASRPEKRGLLLALAFAATPTDDLHTLDVLDAAAALDATLALDALREREDVRLTPAKLERATTVLARLVRGSAEATRALLLHLAPRESAREPGARPVVLDVLDEVVRGLETDAFVATVAGVGDERLPSALALLAYLTRLPFAKERALAEALADHPVPEVRAWAAARAPKPALMAPAWTGVVPLSATERARIAAAPTLEALVDALAPALAMPREGVAGALAARGAYTSTVVCAALLASHDEPQAVARELARWSEATPAFRTELDAEMVRRWRGRHEQLPLVANAWLHLFEAHAFALVERVDREGAGVTGALHEAVALPSALLAQQMWSAVALALEAWSWRDRDRASALGTPALFDLALAQLDTDLGEGAARILVALGRVLPARLSEHLPTIVARLPDLPERTRDRLAPIASARGLGGTQRAPRTRVSSDVEEAIARVRSLADLDALARECAGDVDAVVQEAAIALLMRGQGAGERRIAALLAREPAPPCAPSLAVAVDLFETEAARDEIEALLRATEPRGAAGQPELRFRLALSLARAGRPALVELAIAAACDTRGDIGWLGTVDVERLESLRDPVALARLLVRCPHPRGYERAIQRLLALREPGPADLEAMRAFLLQGRERLESLRQRTAEVLLEHGERIGAPLLLSAALLSKRALPPNLARRMSEGLLGAMVEGALAAGQEHVSQLRLLELLDRMRTVFPVSHDAALRRVLEDASFPMARARARAQLAPARSRDRKLREIAEVFAWGTVRGRELTGRMLRFHITDGGALGYAQMRTGDVNVTPMPILRGERNGRSIVEGLVLHEIGHHAFHATDEALAVWDRAQKRGLARLLNLVLDEHLERNLRSREPEWGDRLKTLAAWAFRHASTDIAIEQLVYLLGERAFGVLSRVRLGIAIAPTCVRVESGSLMAELDAGGHSFARFVRALRLGLGDRTGDPRVEQALALFDRRFRGADPERLWEITLELQRLFAQEIDLVLGVGGAESITSPGELEVHGEGISDADVQREVKRVLEPPGSSGGAGREAGGGDVINVGPDERWTPITQLEVLPPDPAKHAALGATVRRHAERMRRYLETLGLRWEPQRMRLRGARLDTTRLRALVTRRDPRVLIAREIRERTDLFLAIVIDCSGSMQGTSMERAHAFGVLLADAARDVRGIDFRAFGFTDRVIYDAGDARRPAITSLRPGGGNNDAAALAHVVGVARRSSRRAKLVVMISDGLPTECSVAALKACVREAGKKGVACAQVAVRPLEEVCFPDYVVIESAELDSAVARFGEVIARLVRRVMA